jgi:hypothetical protein
MSDWIIWPLGIFLWFVLGLALFIWREVPGLRGAPGRITLSRWVYTVSTKFPMFIAWLYINIGAVIGSLTTHFYWHWCPAIIPLGG